MGYTAGQVPKRESTVSAPNCFIDEELEDYLIPSTPGICIGYVQDVPPVQQDPAHSFHTGFTYAIDMAIRCQVWSAETAHKFV